MGIEFDQVTTKGGDGGTSALLGGERRSKSDIVFEVLGTTDELSVALGQARAALQAAAGGQGLDFLAVAGALRQIQKDLWILGAQVAGVGTVKAGQALTGQDVERIELLEKDWLQGLEFHGFILPGGHALVGPVDQARVLARRAERHLVGHIQASGRTDLGMCQVFLNRLSDVLYVLARRLALSIGLDET